jgi:hypothetical protein
LSFLARAYVDVGQFDDAWSCIGEAMTAIETTKETWCEAEVNRIAGEVTLKSPQLNAATAEGYFERALAVARQQQAKSCVTRVVGARGLVDSVKVQLPLVSSISVNTVAPPIPLVSVRVVWSLETL